MTMILLCQREITGFELTFCESLLIIKGLLFFYYIYYQKSKMCETLIYIAVLDVCAYFKTAMDTLV